MTKRTYSIATTSGIIALLLALAGSIWIHAESHGQIFVRLDQIGQSYARTDVLMPQIEQMQKTLDEIKADVRELRRELKK
jgi:cell division protein FtsB